RLFTEKQRTAMAARDGGCLMCGRPPSWCEAHHIDHWDEHAGRTDIDSGVLLCRFCHLNIHNNRWRIRRRDGDYLLEKPDPDGILRHMPLPSRSPALERLLTG
ncbi:HNH endonuclease signature motif containing protein, partial [Protaetiibacter mangrovi]